MDVTRKKEGNDAEGRRMKRESNGGWSVNMNMH